MNTLINLRILIIILVNAGGEGKTLLAQMLQAIASFIGLKSDIIDADEGNRSISHATGVGSGLCWGADKRIIPEMMAHYDHADVLIADFGANALNPQAANVENIMEMLDYAKRSGRTPFVFVPMTPNKPGAGAGADATIELFSKVATTYLVQNDRDGSGAFADTNAEVAVVVPHIESGFVSVRNRRQLPLDRIITEPEPGYALASGKWASWLNGFARSKPVSDIFQLENGLPMLDSIPGPERGLYTVKTVSDACDKSLVRSREHYVKRRAFSVSSPDDPGFLAVARQYWALLNGADSFE